VTLRHDGRNWEGQVAKELQTQAALLPLVKGAQSGNAADLEELAWRVRPLVYNLAMKYGRGHRQTNTYDQNAGGQRSRKRAGAKNIYGPDYWGTDRYGREGRAEIVQEAWAGFSEAVERYDPDHPAGKPFWTVVSYRVTKHIKRYLALTSGAVPMTAQAWEDAWNIDKALEAEGIVEWEKLSDDALFELTGKRSAGAILRARTPGHTLFETDEEKQDVTHSAEAEYFTEVAEPAEADELLEWLRALDGIPQEHWEEATYWKLEQMGLADDVEAQELIDKRDEILQEAT